MSKLCEMLCSGWRCAVCKAMCVELNVKKLGDEKRNFDVQKLA